MSGAQCPIRSGTLLQWELIVITVVSVYCDSEQGQKRADCFPVTPSNYPFWAVVIDISNPKGIHFLPTLIPISRDSMREMGVGK
jgi:hypothetical protein